MFSDCNANRKEASISDNPEIIRYEIVKHNSHFTVAAPLRRFYQAEVLIPAMIPPEMITFPAFGDKPRRTGKPASRLGISRSLEQTGSAVVSGPRPDAKPINARGQPDIGPCESSVLPKKEIPVSSSSAMTLASAASSSPPTSLVADTSRVAVAVQTQPNAHASPARPVLPTTKPYTGASSGEYVRKPSQGFPPHTKSFFAGEWVCECGETGCEDTGSPPSPKLCATMPDPAPKPRVSKVDYMWDYMCDKAEEGRLSMQSTRLSRCLQNVMQSAHSDGQLL